MQSYDWFIWGQPRIETAAAELPLYDLAQDRQYYIRTSLDDRDAPALFGLAYGSVVRNGTFTSGGEELAGIHVHPPYVNKVGNVTLLYTHLQLPEVGRWFTGTDCVGNDTTCHTEL